MSTLIDLSRDVEAEVRDWATFGLGTQLERDDALLRSALLARIDDADDNTRAEALRGLAGRGEKRAVAPLLSELDRPIAADDPSILYEALFALASQTGDERLCRVVETRGRAWQAEQPMNLKADQLSAALERCQSAGSR